MERGVGDALADLGRELVDMTLALGEYVDQLGSASVAERFGNLAEHVVQRILRLSITHSLTLLTGTSSKNYLTM